MAAADGLGARTRLSCAGVALVLFVCSLIAPALHFQVIGAEESVFPGWHVLMIGWSALFVSNVGWLANLLFWPELVFVGAGLWRVAVGVGAVMVLLALHTLMLIGKPIPADEGGVRHMALSRLDVGFYLWIGSMVVLILSAMWGLVQARRAGVGA